MANVKFNQNELDRHRTKSGVYASLRVTNNAVTLKVAVTSIVESAFRDYARAHKGCTQEMENREWQRFKKFLLKYL